LPRPVRRIVTLHDAFPYLQPETHNRLDNWRYRWHLPPLARRADAVITVSACSKADLVRHLALRDERVHVIGEGIDPRFKPVPDGVHRRAILAKYGLAQPYILYLGGVNGRKNIARLLEAFARARAARPGLTLVIGGPRQWKLAGIEQTLARLDLGAALRLTGYLADEDLPAIYSAAELFVFPSLYEGFGLPPLEAMACATPVVTSNCSSLPEVVGDAALLVDPYSVDSLVAAIEQALDDAQLRATLRRRGLARAAQFSWAHAARETFALYKRVVVQPCTVGQGEPENEGDVPHEY
jgi:glycosyltransferase involved in cell wall biosynthesis